MTTPDTQSTATPNTDFTQTLRYKVGFAMIVVGNLGILIAMVLPALGVGAQNSVAQAVEYRRCMEEPGCHGGHESG